MVKDYYQILEISENSTIDEIKIAFKIASFEMAS